MLLKLSKRFVQGCRLVLQAHRGRVRVGAAAPTKFPVPAMRPVQQAASLSSLPSRYHLQPYGRSTGGGEQHGKQHGHLLASAYLSSGPHVTKKQEDKDKPDTSAAPGIPKKPATSFGGLPLEFEKYTKDYRAFRVIPSDESTSAVMRALVGNVCISGLKFWAWHATKSSAMLSEAIHTLADTGNQVLLLIGTRQAQKARDSRHPYGYGRAAFFWSLISALGMFWLGAGVTTYHGIECLMHPPEALHISLHTWAVLAGSFFIDGSVLKRTLKDVIVQKSEHQSWISFAKSIKDPTILAVIMEDLSAVTGVLIAATGIGMTTVTGNTIYDGLASVCIGLLLGVSAIGLVGVNQKFLLGRSLPQRTQDNIATILFSRPSVTTVYGVFSEWIAPSQFSYRAEIDFDHRYFARKLQDKFAPSFKNASEEEIPVLMEAYADDLTSCVEDEIDQIETIIRHYYPEAAYVDIEMRSQSVFGKVKQKERPYTIGKDGITPTM